MNRKSAFILVGLLLFGCPKQEEQQDPIIPEPFADDDPTQCAAGCKKIQQLGCPEGDPLIYEDKLCQLDSECENGKCILAKCTETCEDVCVDLIKNGRFMGAKCWQTISACEEIETVCRR